MARRIHLRSDISVDELERRYRAAKEPHERSWWQILWQILWLLARGQKAKDIAESTGYSAYWIGQIAKRYNAEGAEGMRNRQYTHSHRGQPLVSPELLGELAEAVRGPAPEGDEWLGRTVAAWIAEKLGRPVHVQLGWVYLWAGSIWSNSRASGASPVHAMCRRIPPNRQRSKKDRPAPGRGREGLPPCAGRALGYRRTPHRPQADPA